MRDEYLITCVGFVEVVAEEILEMHVTHIGTLTVVVMSMRIRGYNASSAHNASKGEGCSG